MHEVCTTCLLLQSIKAQLPDVTPTVVPCKFSDTDSHMNVSHVNQSMAALQHGKVGFSCVAHHNQTQHIEAGMQRTLLGYHSCVLPVVYVAFSGEQVNEGVVHQLWFAHCAGST